MADTVALTPLLRCRTRVHHEMRSLVLMLIAVLALPAAAAAQSTSTVDRSRHLWATVNICDTKRNPDTLGVRASMPGSGRRGEVMYMRFRAQYRSPVEGTWQNFAAAGTDSGWVRVGSALYRARQSGWSFPFTLRANQRFELRGVVRFEWRRRGRVVRRAVKRTTAGHRTAISDPAGFSAATCAMKG